MTERLVTMAMCPHCDQPVEPSRHTTVQCLDNMRRQRDEARKLACGLWEYAEAWFEDQDIEGEYPWLKQSSVDE